MAELNNKSRIKFPHGKQRAFVENIEKDFSVAQIAKWCGKSERTIRDWRREEFLIDGKSLKILCNKAKINLPKNIQILDMYWYVNKGAKVGGQVIKEKYGRPLVDEQYRKQKWYEWWEAEGKQKRKIAQIKPVKEPARSAKLAEFVGIVLGDGCITDGQIAITTNSVDDKEYTIFLKSFLESLFGVSPSLIYRRKSLAVSCVISRVKLVEFCEKIGIERGHKINNGATIPEWVNENPKYLKACIRGLFDTDGCIFYENHKYKNKVYSYPRWAFANASLPLIDSVYSGLQALGFSPKIRNNRYVQLENKKEIKQCFDIIGTNNPKHLKRYRNSIQ